MFWVASACAFYSPSPTTFLVGWWWACSSAPNHSTKQSHDSRFSDCSDERAGHDRWLCLNTHLPMWYASIGNAMYVQPQSMPMPQGPNSFLHVYTSLHIAGRRYWPMIQRITGDRRTDKFLMVLILGHLTTPTLQAGSWHQSQRTGMCRRKTAAEH